MDLEQALHVLHEVELLVGGGGPEVVALVDHALAVGLTLFGDDHDARLLAERRVGEHHVVAVGSELAQGVVGAHGQALLDLGVGLLGLGALLDELGMLGIELLRRGAHPVQHEVHGAQARDALDDLDTP
jgi:hypothetical protein